MKRVAHGDAGVHVQTEGVLQGVLPHEGGVVGGTGPDQEDPWMLQKPLSPLAVLFR